jgi:SAM-dependent methyltransferase
MSIKTILKSSVPRLYSWGAHERNILRLLGEFRDGDIDFGLIADTIKKSRGMYNVECPLCGFIGCFKAFGSPPRWNAQCPSCGSLERHRQLALVLREVPLSGTLLHFAPEDCVTALLKTQPIQYVSADLNNPEVNLKLNIEKINLPDEQYDAIVCSHVLEHVNDRVALLELRRILKSDGILIAMVPIVEGCHATYEDETITRPEEREKHFGQYDHVRVYGADFVQRVADAGFDIRARTAFGKEAVRYGFLMGEKVFICRKTPTPGASIVTSSVFD